MSLLQRLDDLESAAEPHLTLEQAQAATREDLSPLIADGILLVDHRQRLHPDGATEAVTLVRLNRHHPQVQALSTWP